MKNTRIPYLILMLLAFSLPQSSWAIVNVSQSVTDSKVDGLKHTVNISGDGAQGNTEKNTVKANILSQWTHGEHTDFAWIEHAYGKSKGVTNTDRTFAHLRHRTRLDDFWAVEGFVQKGRDAFTRLSDRTLLGGGARLSVIEKEGKRGLYVGLGAFYERERLIQDVGTTDIESKLWRGNVYVIYKQQINEQVQISSTTYYQPALSQNSDYRLLEQAALHVAMFSNVQLKISLDYSYDSKPPQTIRQNDLRYSTGVEIKF
ncbi:MAG: DUF481 domain-containing protein [Ghiorsea sp.]